MDFRDYDPAIARWTGIDPVTHHNMSPYMAFDGNPVFWADPSGADSTNGNALDIFGRDRFDSSGMYIPFAERGMGSFDEYLSQDGGGAGYSLGNYTPGVDQNFMVVLPSNFGDDSAPFWADFLAAMESGIPIMFVDHIGGFIRGLSKLESEGTNVNTFVISSHGSSGKFYIGNTLISQQTMGGDGNVSTLMGIGSKLADKNLIILACNAGSSKAGLGLTQELARQTQTNVITSQHLILGGYRYNGSATPLMSFNTDEKRTGDMFRLSEKGSRPVDIFSLSMNKANGSTTYYPIRQHYPYWFTTQ